MGKSRPPAEPGGGSETAAYVRDSRAFKPALAGTYGSAAALTWLKAVKSNPGSHVHQDSETLTSEVNHEFPLRADTIARLGNGSEAQHRAHLRRRSRVGNRAR